MKTSLSLCLTALMATGAHSQEIAVCRAPVGKAYYHYAGLVGKANAGWSDDKISDGVTTLTRTDGKLDVLFVDTRKKPISSLQEGGTVVLTRLSTDTITVLVYYQDGAATEIYSFFKEKDGKLRFTQMQSKTGAAAPFPKSAVLVGTCDSIKFELMN